MMTKIYHSNMNLNDLEKEYKKIELPEQIVMDESTIILNPKQFVSSHISILKSNTGNKRFKPYYDRLLEVYNKLKNK